MPLDELDNLSPIAIDWQPLDRSLLGDARFRPPPFPLHLLPGRWCRWVQAASSVFGSPDYLAHCLLGGVACAGGAGLRIEVVSHWREPLLLWQALVGGPSSGKSAASARVRRLLEAVVERSNEKGEAEVVGDADVDAGAETPAPATPSVIAEGGLENAAWALRGNTLGVLLWREDLVDWMDEAGRRGGARSSGARSFGSRGRRRSGPAAARAAWVAGWSGGPARIDGLSEPCFAVGIAGALSPERLSALTSGDGALASRLLYAWPERGRPVSLVDSAADDAGIVKMLRRIAGLAGHREAPTVVPFDEGAARRLESLMPALAARADAAEEDGLGDLAAEWIGRGVSTIVRLAGVLALMEWAETRRAWRPVGAAHVEAAHALWADYYLPHALAVFERAGARPGDQAARRVVRWLRRVRATEVSREDVRREALCQSVDADGAEEVLARLEAGGVLRAVTVAEATRRGPRKRRWEVNPGISANSATPLVSSSLGPRDSSRAS